jgi:hypothetical protein
LQQLYNVYEKVFVNQIIPLCTAHNAAVTAFTTAKNDTGYKTAATIDGTTVDTTGTDTTKSATAL